MDTTNLIVSIVGIIISALVAWRFGDLAAVKASRKLHEEDVRKARLATLRSLLNEVARIRKVMAHNCQWEERKAEIRPVIRVPITAFETAFVSREPGLDVSEELLEAVTDYLACADSINSLVDMYPSLIPGISLSNWNGPNNIIDHVKKISTDELPKILERLETCLRDKIDQETRSNKKCGRAIAS